jgi:hypothetical protein
MTNERKILFPDLQEHVTRHGGYQNINWEEWDRVVELWRRARIDELRADLEAMRHNA